MRAMELIAELEREKRGVYAGAVGYFGYGSVDGEKAIEGAMDVSNGGAGRGFAIWRLTESRHALHCGPWWSRTASRIYKPG